MPPVTLEDIKTMGAPTVALFSFVWMIWKASKWLAWRLFDDEVGLITIWFRTQQTTMAVQQAGIANINGSIDGMNRRIDRMLVSGAAASDQHHLVDILIDDNPVPMALVTEEGSFIRTNDAFEDMLGYTREELAGLRWQEITPLAADIAVDAAKCFAIAQGRIEQDRIEKTYRRKDGTTVYCALHIRRFPRIGPFRYFVSIVIPLQPAERQLR